MTYESKNDIAWNKLFKKYGIIKEISKKGHFVISSAQINEYRESRLMTKFDHETNLPEIFKANKLSILPISRGEYIIASLNTYEKIKYSVQETTEMVKRSDLESVDYNNIYSEAAAINCAYLTGIIDDVVGEECEMTISGRMSTKKFDFDINRLDKQEKMKIKVDSSQCEIDAGFEGDKKLILLEAKNEKCDDFLIRQAYYPYRLWEQKVNKQVVPAFMTYSNDIFSFFVYEFEEKNNYNSIKLVEQKNYAFASEPINTEDIKEILKTVTTVTEPKIPFPQADKFERVIDFLGLIMNKDLSKDEITSQYDFDERQTNYYTDAARYLGLIEKYSDAEKIIRYTLTLEARGILQMPSNKKNLEFTRCILKHKAFKGTLEKYLEKSAPPETKDVVGIMKKAGLYKVNSESTYFRRAQTVSAWINWIIGLIDI
jgi:hypothetical protein